MNRALILYHSRRGTTAAYSEEIAGVLSENGIEVNVLPLYRVDNAPVDEADILFLGCWTSGCLFFNQKPEKAWVEYISQIKGVEDKTIVLFTTYKFLTGSMFSEMKKHLPQNAQVSMVKLKSRNSRLTRSNLELLSLLTNHQPNITHN